MANLSLRCFQWIVCCSLLAAATTGVSAQTFQNPPIIPTTTDVASIVTSDVNGDGKADLIYVDGFLYGQRALHILLGNGDGSFTHKQDINLPGNICCGLTVADVTNDGKPDLILGGGNATATVGEVALYVGNGDGSFKAPVVSTIQQGNTGVSANFAGVFTVTSCVPRWSCDRRCRRSFPPPARRGYAGPSRAVRLAGHCHCPAPRCPPWREPTMRLHSWSCTC